MKKLFFLLMFGIPAMAQSIQPTLYGAALMSLDGVTWNPLTSTSTTGAIGPNSYVALLGYNPSTLAWYPCSIASPCTGAGGGGGGTTTAVNGVSGAVTLAVNGNNTVTTSGQTITVGSTSTATYTAVKTGTASNTDLAGTVTLAAGAATSPSITFTGTYASAPVCHFFTQNASATQMAALGAIAAQVSTTTTFATVGTAPTAAVTLGYLCVGRN